MMEHPADPTPSPPGALVALVGRPNVGKSTLFNRLIQRRQAIVERTPGVTRDRLYAPTRWRGRPLVLVDTGGITAGAGDGVEAAVRQQAELAIAQADVVLLVTDARTGATPEDLEVAQLLRRSGRPVLLVANKVDAPSVGVEDLYRLGLGEPLPVSAEHGRGTGDLLDRVVDLLGGPPVEPPESGEADEEEPAGGARGEGPLRVAVVGRPNVGKSSLVNAWLGEERMIVHDAPGTTRDAVDVRLDRGGRSFVLVDTAGMRRRSRIARGLEGLAVMRALKAIERAEVAVLVLDAQEGAVQEDQRIAGFCRERGKGLVVALNKWDLRRGEEGAADDLEEAVRARLSFAPYAPLVRVSARTGWRVDRLLEAVAAAGEAYWRHVPTPALNRVVHEAADAAPAPALEGKTLRIYYAAQVAAGPPTFALFCNHPDLCTPAYRRYLEGRLRQAFPLEGTPIRLRPRHRPGHGPD